ncbi:Thioredoxin domain-containing protein 16 [Fukomys damarensis]|uniref:Thioredoxin domain-containing protein 16 n=1 Tax=Fukomys damarensis TaxID=885580 RepID=A0A091DFA2_FUKDA|nr:Thioredoxin domain-containing protein 16 [Fukomys damarensis]
MQLIHIRFSTNFICICFSALLFNEVKYITTVEDLQNIENTVKGKANMIFSYVRAIGTPEHRAVMEAAFVYGTTYQFVLTTEITLLESIGSKDIEHAHLYFFHCHLVSDLTQQCRRTLMRQPLTTLSIHAFVKTMKAPLLTEVAEDPQQVSTVHLQLGLPLVFVVSRKATYEADRRTAEWIAWRLLGKAGVLLLLRDSLEVNIPKHTNVVFRRAEKELPLEFLVLTDIDSIISYVEDNVHMEENGDSDMGDPDLDIQDDEVAESVYRDRKRQLPLELTVELTEETFNATVMASDSIVLFYAGLSITSIQEAEEYLNGELYEDLVTSSSVSVLGLFSPAMTMAKEDFTKAGNYLKGCVLTGIYSEEDVWILANKYAAPLPALLLARHKEGKIENIPLAGISVRGIVQIVTDVLQETFPEITVENLPTYFRPQKPLLILFSDGSINPQHRKAILTLLAQKLLDSFTPCWLNLKNTPVGRGILQAYFGLLPPLPLLVLVNQHSDGQVFAFPSDKPITEQNLALWLKKLEAGLENHITVLSAQEWKPPLPAYDFLRMMDAATSHRPTGKAPGRMKEMDVQESDKEQHKDTLTVRKEPFETLRIKHWNRNNWFKETEKSRKPHGEL